MKNLIILASGTLLVTALFSGVASATETSQQPNINEDLAQMCEYYPDECVLDAEGAGNGGGNEPPYTPRKPKKKIS